jgi:transposase-like protein
MARRKRGTFTEERKAEVVELCRRGDGSIGEISREYQAVVLRRAA